MATSINTILGWFKTGNKPTQTQFWNSWQSFWHKDEAIPQSSITNLKSTLDSKTDESQFESHKIDTAAHTTLFAAKEDKTQKGISNGYAPLNSFTKLASQYLDIINDLVSGGSTSLLSAEQGVILQNQINNINTLLASDNSNLNTIQEIVDAIETIQTSLNSILINDLTTGGTTKALTAEMGKLLQNTKVDKSTGKSLLADTEINRLATIVNYVHPANHPPGIIAQDTNNRFVTDVEKATWNAKQNSLGFTPENASNKNVANGYAGLGVDGKLISSQIPSITINDTFVVASETEMLALAVETGDLAVRSDLNKSFILKGKNPTLLSDWQELLTPTSDVTTVFGRKGAITAQTGDYAADQITETATKKFQSANQQTFNDVTSSIQTQLDSKVSNATHTGDATGSTVLTVKGINGTLLSGLATGILKNTTNTGVPVIATASDFPILNQNTTGTANNATNLGGQSSTYYAPINSPTFQGIPTGPTPSLGTNTNQLATAAFVALTDFENVKKSGNQTINGNKGFEGNVTFNTGALYLKQPSGTAYNMLMTIPDGIIITHNSNGDFRTDVTSKGIKFGRAAVQAELNTDNLTTSRTFLIPDKAGTIALKGDFLTTPVGDTVKPALVIPNGNLTTIPQDGAIERDWYGILWETHGGVREKISVPDVPYKSITNLNTLFTSYRRSSVNTCQVNSQSEFAPDTAPSWGMLTSCKTDDAGDYGTQTYISMGSIPNTYVRNCNNGTWSAWVKLN
ncbi:hypothetical protein C8C83_3353 [Flavobacterium sp. 90]|uniref:pyocin knob domain-containing protein n=1 Tax=unclassified Flavobacterium TaxID=196869 RepID=UPI000EB583C4|nr:MULTISPECIES: pyocin knob domain-containing protein [unclassified Flavobacterium]RKR11613.1 hypothetical protein C8C82_3664 [Flavobacterium sp. 81]TCK55394.1 hypothetical protein C8C83_3353 [Flavobacterium sp. 90]